MGIKGKVPAFTLMEVTISMLIAAIAIGVTYTAYHIVSVTYQNYIKKQDQVAVYILADHLLKQDFGQARQITRTADGLILGLAGGQVRYEFNADYILRDQFSLRTDTFKLPAKQILISFEGQQSGAGAQVDRLELQTAVQGEDLALVYQKIYSSQDLFN